MNMFGYGIYLDGTSNATGNNVVTGNTGSGNQIGALFINKSNDNEISDNSLSSNPGRGAHLDSSAGNVFTGNTFSSNGEYGLYTSWSSLTEMTGNVVNNNTLDGIRLDNSYECQLSLNTMSNNASGLYLSSSDSAAIHGNSLSSNGTGISINTSQNNTAYNNNFTSNTVQAVVAGGSGNSFSLPAPDGGNYWDDFDEETEGCADANGNGFCDAAYVFSGGQDSLPWTSFNGWVDTTPPTVENVLPTGTVTSASVGISADYSDSGSGIDTGSVVVTLDGTELPGCSVGATSVNCPISGLGTGAHVIGGSVSDLAGNPSVISGSFTMARNYYFTWYDDYYASNWVLMANPTAGGGGDSQYFEMRIGTRTQDLSPFQARQGSTICTGCAPGEVPPVHSLTPNFPGPENMDGPVKVSSLTGEKTMVSERTVWPRGGFSLEEVVGFDASRLSSHYYWTWYDQQSPGYTNWVLVANPSESEIVRVEILVAGNIMQNLLDAGRPDHGESYFDIAPGANVKPTFPGVKGGPVEIRAYRGPSTPGGGDSGSWDTPVDRRDVIASQRVLSGFGAAFNEALGVPQAELSDHYVWTWYDTSEPGTRDWVLVANPADAGSGQYLHYEIRIGGDLVCEDSDSDHSGAAGCPAATPGSWQAGPIAPGGYVTPEFPNMRGGPVELLTFSDDGHQNPADAIASQRIVWGPSFGETMGYRHSDLAGEYHWTWYDQQSLGMQDWVLVANPADAGSGQYLHYEIRIGGDLVCEDSDSDHSGAAGCPAATPGSWQAGPIAPGGYVTPEFPNMRGGPVELLTFSDDGHQNPADAIASQRVLYNGFFNEVVGTVLN